MLARRKNERPERTRPTHPGLIAMAAAAMLSTTFVPAFSRVHDEACQIVATGPQPCLDWGLITALDTPADDALAIPDLSQQAERE